VLKNFPVIVDTVQKSKLNNIVVNTNDLKTIMLSLTINQLNKPIDLTGATVRIAIVKPDKKTVFQDCTITDPTTGSCEVVLDTQAFIISGVYIAEVMIYYGADTVAVTGRFSYSVSSGILDNSTVESTNEWQSITQAIADAEGILIDLRENGTGIDVQARSELETVTTQLADTELQIDAMKSYGVTLESYPIQIPEVDDTPRIKRAIAAAGVVGRVIIPPKTFNISDKITFDCYVDASGATFNVTSNIPIAVEVREGTGSTLFRGKTVRLPNVVKQVKTWNGTDTGVQLTNVYESDIYFGEVRDFSKGVCITAFGTGTSYNNIFFKNLSNNKINLQLIPGDGAAWVNENNFFGGRFAHSSSEGTNVIGSRQILISNGGFACNNNTFYKPSIEGNVPEFHIECWGKFNSFMQPRFEATIPKVAYRAIDATNYAHSNVIFYGYNTNLLQITEDALAKWNHIYSREQVKVHGSSSGANIVGINAYGNNSPTFAVLDALSNLSSNVASEYMVGIGANYSRYKRKTDTNPRIEIDHSNSKINFGGGTAATDVNVYRYGAIGFKTDNKLLTVSGLGVGNSAAATTLGTVTKKMEVFDANGVSLGFVPIYGSIT